MFICDKGSKCLDCPIIDENADQCEHMIEVIEVAHCEHEDNINIIGTEAWANRFEPNCPHGVFGIDWEAENIGFGRLELFFDENGKAHIHSENMDSNDDKRFTKAVLMKVIEDAVIEE